MVIMILVSIRDQWPTEICLHFHLFLFNVLFLTVWQCICIIYESLFLTLLSRKYYRGKEGNVVGKPAPLPDILDDTEQGAAFKLRNMVRRISSAF